MTSEIDDIFADPNVEVRELGKPLSPSAFLDVITEISESTINDGKSGSPPILVETVEHYGKAPSVCGPTATQLMIDNYVKKWKKEIDQQTRDPKTGEFHPWIKSGINLIKRAREAELNPLSPPPIISVQPMPQPIGGLAFYRPTYAESTGRCFGGEEDCRTPLQEFVDRVWADEDPTDDIPLMTAYMTGSRGRG